ncbi:hypothetical protein H072_3371 [Dactylellina haptotyla CBS 200.50]|uniref:Uncharacterized protein n=1 Tax=Dactylellina haptotyla (strain CBS 200.50) TaxID=1284197 RepID=S8AN40_DACHA|nr:hypothetical protein H072_3371 [Dactylellina haptotyla CBS 200.50]
MKFQKVKNNKHAMNSFALAAIDAAHEGRKRTLSSVSGRSRKSLSVSDHEPGSAVEVDDDDDDNMSVSSTSSHEGGRKLTKPLSKKQHYKVRAHELYDDYKYLPESLQKVVSQHYKRNKWTENKELSSAPTRGRGTGPRSRPIPRRSKALPRDVDEERMQEIRAARREESPPRYTEFWQDSYVEIGENRVPRIDLRNPIVIDPLATTIPNQSRKLISISEISTAYQKSIDDDQLRDLHFAGVKMAPHIKRKLEIENAENEGRLAPLQVPGPMNMIPFKKFKPASTSRLFSIPKPPFKFLDIVKVPALKYLPGSKLFRPYDWIPTKVGNFDRSKILPAIFWDASDEEAASIVFYIFPTTQNIRDPISIGAVDDDQGVANISLVPLEFISESRKKSYFSGYIDFSRPMIVPHEVISTTKAKAMADEGNFWDVWRGLFKKPTFEGHQYGMTLGTRPFENPVRLMQLFESKMKYNGNYTVDLALAKEPMHTIYPTTLLPDDDSDDGSKTVTCLEDCENIAECSDDDSKTVMGYNLIDDNGDAVTVICLNDKDDTAETAINDENDSNRENNGNIANDANSQVKIEAEKRANTQNWLDAIIDRPPTITLDETVKIPKMDEVHKIQKRARVYTPLDKVDIREDGIRVSIEKTYTNPIEYSALNNTEETENILKQRPLSGFDRRLLKLMNQCIATGGKPAPFSSKHTEYVYEYPDVQDTKDLVRRYRKECIEAARQAEVKETGSSELGEKEFPWDEHVHERAMKKLIPILDVLEAWKSLFGSGYPPDAKLTQSRQAAEKAKHRGLMEIPGLWVPDCIMAEIERKRMASSAYVFGSGKKMEFDSDEEEEEMNSLSSSPIKIPVIPPEIAARLGLSQKNQKNEPPKEMSAPPSLGYHRLKLRSEKHGGADKGQSKPREKTPEKIREKTEGASSDATKPKSKSKSKYKISYSNKDDEDEVSQTQVFNSPTIAASFVQQPLGEDGQGIRITSNSDTRDLERYDEKVDAPGSVDYIATSTEYHSPPLAVTPENQVATSVFNEETVQETSSTEKAAASELVYPSTDNIAENTIAEPPSPFLETLKLAVDDYHKRRTAFGSKIECQEAEVRAYPRLLNMTPRLRPVDLPLPVDLSDPGVRSPHLVQVSPEQNTATSITSPDPPTPESLLHRALERLKAKVNAHHQTTANRSEQVGKVHIPEMFERHSPLPPEVPQSSFSTRPIRRNSPIFTSRPVRQSAPTLRNLAGQAAPGDLNPFDTSRRRFQTVPRRSLQDF